MSPNVEGLLAAGGGVLFLAMTVFAIEYQHRAHRAKPVDWEAEKVRAQRAAEKAALAAEKAAEIDAAVEAFARTAWLALRVVAVLFLLAWAGTWAYDELRAVEWGDLLHRLTPPSWR